MKAIRTVQLLVLSAVLAVAVAPFAAAGASVAMREIVHIQLAR